MITFKTSFNRNARLDKEGLGLIHIVATSRGKRIYFNTGIKVRPDQFSHGEVINHELADKCNRKLKNVKLELASIELDMDSPTLRQLREAYLGNSTPSANLVDFGRGFINNSTRDQKTKDGYETTFRTFEKFMPQIQLSDVTYNTVEGFENFMVKMGLAENTIIGRMRHLKAIMNEAYKRELIKKNPFMRYKMKQMKHREEFLTKREVKLFESLNVKGIKEIIKDAFLFCCFSGLRFSDIVTLSSKNIDNGKWITVKTQKTGEIAKIPIATVFDGKALSMIDKYGTIENLVKKIPTNATSNKYIKEMMNQIGVTKHITFHSSRHTFATLLLEQGVSITSIQKMLGHTKVSTTQIYAEITSNTIENDVKKALKKHKNTKNFKFVTDSVTEDSDDDVSTE